MQFSYENSPEYQDILSEDKEIFEFFWESGSIFSQWHPAEFRTENLVFPTAEHFMMYGKAMLFNDYEVAQKILVASHPRDVKALGKKVENFSDRKWNPARLDIVYQANYYKFTQNLKLKDKLLATKGKTLVEASPYDRIWGIGLTKDHEDAQSRETWKGENLLGKILTELRYNLANKRY
jgi:hypothetical protein